MGSLIYVLIIIGCLVLLILSVRAYKKERIFVSGYKLKKADILEIISCFIYQNVCQRIILKYLKGSFMEYLFQSPRVKKDLRAIEPEVRPEVLEAQYYVKKIKNFLLMFLAGVILALCISISNLGQGEIYNGKYIDRNTYGGRPKQLSLQVITKDGEYEDKVDLSIGATTYTCEELDVLYDKAIKELDRLMWGENTLNRVTEKSLNFPSALEGYPFELEWESSNYFLMNHSGEIQKTDIDEKGENVIITCSFIYGDWEKSYSMSVNILPKEQTTYEVWKEQVRRTLDLSEEEQKDSSTYILPEQIGQKDVYFTEIKEDHSLIIFGLLVITACCVYVMQDYDLHKKTAMRDNSMLAEYPALINRITLYLGAGMTIKGAWNKIAGDYSKRKNHTKERNFLYEEMLYSCYEMQCGVSESSAYERFGKRCGLQPYTKLIGLLSQSMRKGNMALLSDLQKEAEDAQEIRRSVARKKGEEAGTKLLIPMIMMLAIVMVLVMFPAFFSFSV